MGNESDWRLMGKEKYLQDRTFVWKKYVPPSAKWDHDHCEFCLRKFTVQELPDSLHEGYTTEDNYHWICAECFADFRQRFNWKVDGGG
jgi:hypothetical protein